MQYKLAHPSLLSPSTLYSTVEEAVGEGRSFWPGDTFFVFTVREALLSDFFNATTLWGDLRETMAERTGDDSALDVDDERKAPVAALFHAGITVALDEFTKHAEIDLSGVLIVEARAEVKPLVA